MTVYIIENRRFGFKMGPKMDTVFGSFDPQNGVQKCGFWGAVDLTVKMGPKTALLHPKMTPFLGHFLAPSWTTPESGHQRNNDQIDQNGPGGLQNRPPRLGPKWTGTKTPPIR
jgi:hypothetical protein